MNTPQYVYNLIGMSQSHIDAWYEVRDYENAFDKAIEGMNGAECRDFIVKWKEENPPPPFNSDTLLGKAYRGSFLDLDALIKIIEDQDDYYGICESHYTYLLIEKIPLGVLDGVTCFDKDGEIWYKMNEDYQYKRIEKPDCFKGTCNFT